MCFCELLKNNEIQKESNIVYLKCFSFNNLRYGIPCNISNVRIECSNLVSIIHGSYIIEIITSFKDIPLKEELFEQCIIANQIQHLSNICKNKKYDVVFNHPVSIIIMTFMPKDDFIESDIFFENDHLELNEVSLFLNGHALKFYNDELIKIKFLGTTTFAICIDPQLKDYKKFTNYLSGKFDHITLKSINFSRIDSFKLSFDYESQKQYNVCINGMHMNVLRSINNELMVAFAS